MNGRRKHWDLMKIIAIANQKGGVGKTTTAVNLSAALAMRGQRTLLIDLDPQANASSGIGLEPEEDCSLYGPLLGQSQLVDKIQTTRIENLSAVPAEMDLAGVEIELARMDNHLSRLQGVLAQVRSKDVYDFCILDTPPSLGVLMTSALAAADEILIPLQCEWFGLEGLAKIAHVIEQIKDSGVNAGVTLEGILMTMYDGRTNLSRSVVEEVGSFFPEQLYKTVIPRTVRLGEAPSHGRTIFEHDPNGVGASSYSKAADEFLSRHGVNQGEAAGCASDCE
ncbi:MAG: ParA family protein [Akkermansiaceae bacterium]|jgi:chromosome partitioning protein|nr:ParA family protein [Akkermansiaceae bacterium]